MVLLEFLGDSQPFPGTSKPVLHHVRCSQHYLSISHNSKLAVLNGSFSPKLSNPTTKPGSGGTNKKQITNKKQKTKSSPTTKTTKQKQKTQNKEQINKQHGQQDAAL